MIGHDGQIDIKQPEKSGFADYIEHFRNEPYAKVCELTVNFRGRLAQHADELTW
jgi:phosphate starvation-inducible PhoH-like protein